MRYVVIGNSAAGITAAETLRRYNPDAAIDVISSEDAPIYSRCLLTYYLAGVLPKDKLLYRPENFYRDYNLTAHPATLVTRIDSENKQLHVSGKDRISYDKLVVATGARSKMPDIPGIQLTGIYPLRDIADMYNIESVVQSAKKVVILGGGLIGLKTGQALKHLGLEVAVVVKSGRLLSQMLDSRASEIFLRLMTENGIEMIPGKEAVAFEGSGKVERVVLDDGTKLDAQLVIVGKGVHPNKELIAETGGDTGYGIRVDEYLKTSINDIYAAGDVIETTDLARGEMRINAMWPCAVEQGRIAAMNISGIKTVYTGSLSMNTLEFFHIPVISMGILAGQGPEYEEDCVFNQEKNIYKKTVYKNNRIVGMVFVNEIDNAGVVGTLIKHDVEVSTLRGQILREEFSFAHIMPVIREQLDKFPEREFRFPDGKTS